MYAIDRSISSSSENLLQLLEDLRREVEWILEWLRQNKLSLNIAKCKYMFIGKDKEVSEISEIGNIKTDKDEIIGANITKYLV